jgi:hypothetical protein
MSQYDLQDLILRHVSIATDYQQRSTRRTNDRQHLTAMSVFHTHTAEAIREYANIHTNQREIVLQALSDAGQSADAYDAQRRAEHERDMYKQAVVDLCEEFRGHDLPHGSSAYNRAMSLVNGIPVEDTVNITALKDHNRQLIAALKPFMDFAKQLVDGNGWINNSGGSHIGRYFGPEDFWAVKKAMAVQIPALLPCPFCGLTDLTVMENGERELSVHCEDCDADASLERWNHRTTK